MVVIITMLAARAPGPVSNSTMDAIIANAIRSPSALRSLPFRPNARVALFLRKNPAERKEEKIPTWRAEVWLFAGRRDLEQFIP